MSPKTHHLGSGAKKRGKTGGVFGGMPNDMCGELGSKVLCFFHIEIGVSRVINPNSRGLYTLLI